VLIDVPAIDGDRFGDGGVIAARRRLEIGDLPLDTRSLLTSQFMPDILSMLFDQLPGQFSVLYVRPKNRRIGLKSNCRKVSLERIALRKGGERREMQLLRRKEVNKLIQDIYRQSGVSSSSFVEELSRVIASLVSAASRLVWGCLLQPSATHDNPTTRRDRILGLRIISAHYAVIKHPLRRMPERAGLCLRRARMRRSRVSPVLFA